MSDLGDWVLHMPIWIALLVLILGFILWMMGNRRRDKTIERIGAVVALLAVVLGSVGFLNPSARQLMEDRTHQLIDAIGKKDWNAAKSLLDSDTTVGTPSTTIKLGKHAIVAAAQIGMQEQNVHSLTVSGLNSKQMDSRIIITLTLYSTQESTQDRPLVSTWQFEYQRSGKSWLLDKIIMVTLNQENADDFVNEFPK